MVWVEERRRFKRYEICCPAQYRYYYHGPKNHSLTINMSEGGALISTTHLIDVATNILVKFFLRDEDFSIQARVVHFQIKTKDGAYHLGIEFLDRSRNFVFNFYEELELITLYQRQYIEEMGRAISLSEASIKWYCNSRDWLSS